MEFGVVLMAAVMPSLPLERVPTGQLGILLIPGLLANSGLIVLKCFVKTKVVPLESARTTTLIGESGSLAPGFVRAMRGSLHFLTVPRKMPAYAFRDSRSSGTP